MGKWNKDIKLDILILIKKLFNFVYKSKLGILVKDISPIIENLLILLSKINNRIINPKRLIQDQLKESKNNHHKLPLESLLFFQSLKWLMRPFPIDPELHLSDLIDHTMIKTKSILININHLNLEPQLLLVLMFFLLKLGVTIKIQLIGLCHKNLMESDVFGQEPWCIQEMEIGSIHQNGLLKTGQRVNLMANFLLVEDNFPKLYQLSRKIPQSILNGKMLDIWYLMLLDWNKNSKKESKWSNKWFNL